MKSANNPAVQKKMILLT